MSVLLEVSLGEAIDKLTILDIKKDKIKDERLIDIMKEYDYLYKQLEDVCNKYEFYYKALRDVNLKIWELQDELRNDRLEQHIFLERIEVIFNYNDSRFLIKKKINNLGDSTFKEQKGYPKRILCIDLCNITQNNIILINPCIRYYSFFYDNIFIKICDEFSNVIVNMFNDDKCISITNDLPDCDHDYVNIINKTKNIISHSFFKGKNVNNEVDNLELKCIYDNLCLCYEDVKKYEHVSKK